MIPGEIHTVPGTIALNAGRERMTLRVANTGDRPIQVGSHHHFYETNPALDFDREQTRGFPSRYTGRHRGTLRAGPIADRGSGRLRRVAQDLRLQRKGHGPAG